MGFFTEIGKKYNVTGDMGAWDNYTPANPNDAHARGKSTGTAAQQLKGKVVQITEHVHRVEEGYPDPSPGPYAPFEVVKVTVEGGDGTEYYAWVVYNGVVAVEEVVEEKKEDPDPKEDPSKPDEKQPTNRKEIHVKAGETVVMEVTAGEKKESKEKSEIGSIEVELVDINGKPFKEAEVVHLLESDFIYSVHINKKTGKGFRSDIPIGEYELALRLGMVYFEKNKKELAESEKKRLIEISSTISESTFDFRKIRCAGYAYNEQLCIERAINVKGQLTQLLKKISVGNFLTGVIVKKELKGKSEGEKENNRVDIFGLL